MAAKTAAPVIDPLDEVRKDPRDINTPPAAFDPGFGRSTPRPPILVGDDVYWVRIYWLYGEAPKGSASNKRSEVKDPPTSGWSHAFLIDPGTASKLVTLFCPYTMTSYQVSRDSYEMEGTAGPFGGFPRERIEKLVIAKWEEYAKASTQVDYGTAAIIFRAMGLVVPQNILPEGAEVKQTGGKEVTAGTPLTKPVKRDGRRGEVLTYFLEADGHKASIHGATARFGISRSNLLSQLFLLRKEHGIGYVIEGDTATIQLPDGCTDPFA